MRYDKLRLRNGSYIAPPEAGGIEEVHAAGPNPDVVGPLLGFTFVLPDAADEAWDWFYFVPVTSVEMAMRRIGKPGSVEQ